MAKFIEARVIQKVDTEANWMANPLKLYQGEAAFVSDKYNFKLNTSKTPKTFAELEYYYKGDIISGVLPTDDLASKPDGVYRATISGTYSGVVVKEGYYTLLRKDNGVWKLESEVEMPEASVEGKVEEGDVRAVSGGEVYDYVNEVDAKIVYKAGANIHNPLTDKMNTLLSIDGSSEVTATLYNTTDFIKIESGDSYKCSHQMRKLFVYEQKGAAATNILDLVSGNTGNVLTGNYVRFSYSNTATPELVRFGKTADDINVPFAETVYTKDDKLILTEDSIVDEAGADIDKIMNQKAVTDYVLSQNKIDFVRGANILNFSTILFNSSINDTTGAITASETYDVSDFIEVEELTDYSSKAKYSDAVNILRRTVYFNSNKNVIGAVNTAHGAFTTPSACSYIRVMFAHNPLIFPIAIAKGTERYYEDYSIEPVLIEDIGDNATMDNTIMTKKSIDKYIGQNMSKHSITVHKNGGNIKIRTFFDDTRDLVRTIELFGSQNGASNLTHTRFIGKNDDINSSGTLLQHNNDSMPGPLKINSRKVGSVSHFNVGGNHGLQSVIDANSTAHGKTTEDLLSLWTDGTGWEWYLVEILSADSLRFIGKPNNIDGFDYINVNPGSTLTHVSGATNTADLTVSGGGYEYKPAIRNISVKLYVDGLEITEDGYYSGNEVKVIDIHSVADPTQPNLTIPYVPNNNGILAENRIITTFFPNNTLSTETIFESKKITNYIGYNNIRPQILTNTNYDSYKVYAMNVGVVDDYNFDIGVNLKTAIPYIYVNKSHLKEQDKAVKSVSSILSTSSSPKIGMNVSFNPFVGFGKSDYMLTQTQQMYISDAKKIYPVGFSGESGLNIINGIEYLAYWDASVNPKLSTDFYIPYGNGNLYYISVKDAMSKEVVKLKKELTLREYEVIHMSSGFQIHTENATTSEGLIISASVGDWAILKIK